MVQYYDLFAQAALTMKNRYHSLTKYASPLESNTPQTAPAEEPQETTTPVEDSYETTDKPADDQAATKQNAEKATYENPLVPVNDTDAEDTETTEESVPAVPAQESTEPDFIKRSVSMNYKMKLQFDLAAFTQTVEEIADGDVSIEEFAAAGFGLKAMFDIKGKEIIETNMTDDAVPSKLNGFSFRKGMQAGKFALQAKDFNLRSFYRESSSIANRMHIETADGYRRAVNKFALRYHMDNRFSFEMLNRFNSQTQQMLSGADNAAVAGYVDTAGEAASKVTPEVMATFFNAVDEYLNAAETDLAAKAEEFFSMAAEQLGLSGELVDSAKAQVMDTVESFFDRVDTALASMESLFVPGSTELPEERLMQPDQPLEMDNKTALAMA